MDRFVSSFTLLWILSLHCFNFIFVLTPAAELVVSDIHASDCERGYLKFVVKNVKILKVSFL